MNSSSSLPAGVQISAYKVKPVEPGSGAVWVELCVQRDGSTQWAVRRDGDCLSTGGQWEDEPSPSNRDEGFLARCRFATAELAIQGALGSVVP